jgi:hypothetical protein
MDLPPFPTSFLGLFLFSTALSLVCTFTVVGVLAVVRRVRQSNDPKIPRLR